MALVASASPSLAICMGRKAPQRSWPSPRRGCAGNCHTGARNTMRLMRPYHPLPRPSLTRRERQTRGREGDEERPVGMKAQTIHPWQVTTHEAIATQKRLRTQVITHNTVGEIRYIAGADISTTKDSPRAFAGVVVLSYP